MLVTIKIQSCHQQKAIRVHLWRKNNRMILGLIESDQVFWLFGKPFVRCGRFDWIGKNILWKAQKTYSEINVLSEKKTKTNFKSEIKSSKWLVQGLAWSFKPDVDRKGTKINRKWWESLERPEENDTYWMDIIEVVGFSVIGNFSFIGATHENNFRNIWCDRKLCNVRYLGIEQEYCWFCSDEKFCIFKYVVLIITTCLAYWILQSKGNLDFSNRFSLKSHHQSNPSESSLLKLIILCNRQGDWRTT